MASPASSQNVDEHQIVIARKHFYMDTIFCSKATVTLDLLISDVMMPGMTGVELALQVRIAQPECKVLLFWKAATAGLLEQA